MFTQHDTKERQRSLPRTAVFIDGDWLIHTARRVDRHLDFALLFAAIRAHFGRPTIAKIYLSTDEQNPKHRQFVALLSDIGYSVYSAPIIRRGNIAYSRSLDVQLAADAASLSPEFDRLVLISGDNDFLPLLQHAKAGGRSTVLLALPLVTGATLTATADHFATVEDLLGGMVEPLREQELLQDEAEKPVPLDEIAAEVYVERGQHLGPYILIRELFTRAKQHVTVVDRYVDHQILLMVPLLLPGVSVEIVMDKINVSDFCNFVQKLRREGHQINIYRTDQFHDRYLEVDGEWWHSGHSFKDLGNKDSRISKVIDQGFVSNLAQRVRSALASATVLCR